MKVVILAGGSGTRLWPLSRERFPKQFVKYKENTPSLFQQTFSRSLLLVPLEDIFVVTNAHQKFLVLRAIEELGYAYNEGNVVIEPEAKNTLPAIYAGVAVATQSGDDYCLVFPSDHVITHPEDFLRQVRLGEPLVAHYLVTFGVEPTEPNTGYGYICPGPSLGSGYVVHEFKEKPDFNTVLDYVARGYYWNSGIFLFDSKLFRQEVEQHAPDITRAFTQSSNLTEIFAHISRKISIDYGLLEKSTKVAVVPTNCGWSDLGSFDSFYALYEQDAAGNAGHNHSILVDSSNNLIKSEEGKVVAAIGVDDLVIIDSRDALLVCKRDQAQRVKEVVETLKSQSDLRAEYHLQDYRPWGHYTVLEEQKGSYKIKRIVVHPGKKLSYQFHNHRSEHWIVVSGMASVTIEGQTRFVRTGESVFIRAGELHQLANPGMLPLSIVEVQQGAYLEEDDIIRLEDDYARA